MPRGAGRSRKETCEAERRYLWKIPFPEKDENRNDSWRWFDPGLDTKRSRGRRNSRDYARTGRRNRTRLVFHNFPPIPRLPLCLGRCRFCTTTVSLGGAEEASPKQGTLPGGSRTPVLPRRSSHDADDEPVAGRQEKTLFESKKKKEKEEREKK